MTRTRDENLVRQRREDLGMLLIDLARAIDRSAGFVSFVEGGYVPKRTSQVKLAAALNTTPEALWPKEYA